MITRRRQMLDKLMHQSIPFITTPILDAGGKKSNHRGTFMLINHFTSQHITTVNTDPNVSPDVCCDITSFKSNFSYKSIVCTETLEHLENPVATLHKFQELTFDGSILVLSMPWLVPIHGDPFDFQRWTIKSLVSKLSNANFTPIMVYRMGGIGDVFLDLFHVYLHTYFNNRLILKIWSFIVRFNSFAFPPQAKLVSPDDPGNSITTGWFIICRRF